MAHINKKDICRISLSEANENHPILGRFLEGYKSNKDYSWYLFRYGIGIINIIVGVYIIIVAISHSARKSSPIYDPLSIEIETPYMIIIGFIICIIGLYVIGKTLSMWIHPVNVRIHEKGFEWEATNNKGWVLNKKTILFDDVASITYSKIRKYCSGIYYNSDYRLKVTGKHRRTMFENGGTAYNPKEIIDKGQWINFALEAIVAQWDKIAIERMNEDYNQNKELVFTSDYEDYLHLSSSGVSNGRIYIEWKDVSAEVRSRILSVRKKNQKQSKKNTIYMNLNVTPNADVLIAALNLFLAKV